jgi:hypothetical protein
MAAIYNDGSAAYGSRVLTFSTSGAMVAESVSVERPTKIIAVENEIGEPSKQVVIADFVTATATVQIASAVPPALGETFTTTVSTAIGAETFIVTNVSQPEEQAGLKKCTIQARKKIN